MQSNQSLQLTVMDPARVLLSQVTRCVKCAAELRRYTVQGK